MNSAPILDLNLSIQSPQRTNSLLAQKMVMKDISWKLSDSIYVIVLHEDELTMLQGTNIDTRKESQRESQKNS